MDLQMLLDSFDLSEERADEVHAEFKKVLREAENAGEVVEKLGLGGERDLKAFLVGQEVAKAEITGNALGTFQKVLGDHGLDKVMGRFLK